MSKEVEAISEFANYVEGLLERKMDKAPETAFREGYNYGIMVAAGIIKKESDEYGKRC